MMKTDFDPAHPPLLSDDAMTEKMFNRFRKEGLTAAQIALPAKLKMACEACVYGRGEHESWCAKGARIRLLRRPNTDRMEDIPETVRGWSCTFT